MALYPPLFRIGFAIIVEVYYKDRTLVGHNATKTGQSQHTLSQRSHPCHSDAMPDWSIYSL